MLYLLVVAFITVAVFPTAPEVVEGTNLTLICETVVSPPDSDIEIVWMFMNIISICDSDRVECFDNKAIIINFRAEDQGFYSCEASTSSTAGFGLTMATVICKLNDYYTSIILYAASVFIIT